ncbi:MAG: hypothetical protein AAF960_09590 [Bacteroidota bacterium]
MKRLPLLLGVLLVAVWQLGAEVVYSAPLQAKELGMGNLLNWKTTFEEDVQHFDIEKSANGVDFENIGTVESAADLSDEKAYRFFDTKLGSQKSYYRLKVVESDGTSSYSQTILVNKEKLNQFAVVAYSSVMPKANFDLTLDAVTEGQLEYALISYKGELIFEEFQYLYPGLNEVQLSMQDLPEGTYKIKLKLDTEEEYLVIQKASDGQKSNVASSQKIKKND